MTQAQFDIVTLLAWAGVFPLAVLLRRHARPGAGLEWLLVATGSMVLLQVWQLVDDVMLSTTSHPVGSVQTAGAVVFAVFVLACLGLVSYRTVRARARGPRA
jgi:hypothetical protein